MIKYLTNQFKPEKLYNIVDKSIIFFGFFTIILIITGTAWALLYSPSDYQQGETVRLIYIHVPAAILSLFTYFCMAVFAFIYLVWQFKMSGIMSISLAPIGSILTLITLISGSLWGKPMWGTFWIWDARLTSELILLMLFLGIIFLNLSLDLSYKNLKLPCLLALVGVVNLPIIHFSVEWWNTLHQGPTITKFEKPSIDHSMLLPLLFNIFSYFITLATFFLLTLRNNILKYECKRNWVLKLIKE